MALGTAKSQKISIHALREEGDADKMGLKQNVQISIHALREEGDQLKPGKTQRRYDFYPRPPRGGRRAMAYNSAEAAKFLSTPSARRATSLFVQRALN